MAKGDINLQDGMAYFTPDELRAVRVAVRGSINLRNRYVALRYEDPKMKRKQMRLRKELVHLRSAQKKLK